MSGYFPRLNSREFDQEMLQSQTTHQPTALREGTQNTNSHLIASTHQLSPLRNHRLLINPQHCEKEHRILTAIDSKHISVISSSQSQYTNQTTALLEGTQNTNSYLTASTHQLSPLCNHRLLINPQHCEKEHRILIAI